MLSFLSFLPILFILILIFIFFSLLMNKSQGWFSFQDLVSAIARAAGIIMLCVGLIMGLNVLLKGYVFDLPSRSIVYELQNCNNNERFPDKDGNLKTSEKTDEEIAKCEERVRKNQKERDNFERKDTLINGLVLLIVGGGLWASQKVSRRKEEV